MRRKIMITSNEEVIRVVVDIPEKHWHLRTTIVLQDGWEFTFQEATITNLVRAYINIKTHPANSTICLIGQRLLTRKDDFGRVATT